MCAGEIKIHCLVQSNRKNLNQNLGVGLSLIAEFLIAEFYLVVLFSRQGVETPAAGLPTES